MDALFNGFANKKSRFCTPASSATCLSPERRARGRNRFQRVYSANSVISVG